MEDSQDMMPTEPAKEDIAFGVKGPPHGGEADVQASGAQGKGPRIKENVPFVGVGRSLTMAYILSRYV